MYHSLLHGFCSESLQAQQTLRPVKQACFLKREVTPVRSMIEAMSSTTPGLKGS